jgi:hypothetical protein
VGPIADHVAQPGRPPVVGPAGTRLATTTVDERAFAIRIWDWPTGVETLKLRDSGLRVALSPDGRLLAGVRPRQPVPFVRVWALDPELLLRDRVAAPPAR